MYYIKWNENGQEKSIVAESWIERDALLEQYQQFNPSYELI